LKIGVVPALVDTGAQFSCVRSDVAEFLYLMDEPCVFLSCSVVWVLADGQRCQVNNAVRLHMKLLSYSWNHEFKILGSGPFSAILGLDFLRRTGMTIDVAAKKYGFPFAPQCSGTLFPPNPMVEKEQFLQTLGEEVCNVSSGSEASINGMNLDTMVADFLALFSSTVGTANCAPCDIELSDPAPVWSQPYWCAPPKLAIFKNIVNELLAQGVVRPSKSPYASPAFLVPKNGGGFHLVVDYRKVNTKIIFDSYPMPTIEQAFSSLAEQLYLPCQI
jgi:hypothetical protein